MNDLQKIKYNRIHQVIIKYIQSLRIENFTDNDMYYDGPDPILAIYHKIPMMVINKFFIPFDIEDELLNIVIPKLLKCENYLTQITN